MVIDAAAGDGETAAGSSASLTAADPTIANTTRKRNPSHRSRKSAGHVIAF